MTQYERPKGFVPWRPQTHVAPVVSQAQAILQEYSQYGAMTCRQIFYRLVGQYDYDKTEKAYNRLCEYLVRARRAQMIPFGEIRDDGGFAATAGGMKDPAEWWQSLEDEWQSYARDRSEGQEYAVELWCEAEGIAPMLARAAAPYGVATYATGGFSSVTVTHQIARRAARRERPTLFLHVGDYDPSGASIFRSMSDDARKFFYQSKHWDDAPDDLAFTAVRVALTEEQVQEYDLPTAPPKASDSRSANWVGETCQLEAMAPSDLTALITSTIEEVYDMGVYRELLQKEYEERELIKEEWVEMIEEHKR